LAISCRIAFALAISGLLPLLPAAATVRKPVLAAVEWLLKRAANSKSIEGWTYVIRA